MSLMEITGIESLETVILTGEDKELRLFIKRLRSAKKMVVQDGAESFVVEIKPTAISDEARALLARGGPG